jgi:hypothetical protein
MKRLFLSPVKMEAQGVALHSAATDSPLEEYKEMPLTMQVTEASVYL